MTDIKSYDSRSPSPRSRRGYDSYDSYSDYSESFVSDSESEISRPKGKKNTKGKTTKKPVNHKRKDTKTSKTMTPRVTDSVTRRMLSARRVKINEYRNEVQDMQNKIHELHTENKTLRRQYHIQGRALERFEIQENELPSLIQKHLEETRMLKDQIKKQKDKARRSEERVKNYEHELTKCKKQMKKYKGLVEEKNLAERDELSQKVSKLEAISEDKDQRIKDLEKYIDNLTKNHRHQLGVEGARQRETQRRAHDLKESNERLQNELKEKLKELEIRNIYANRIIRAPHKLPPTAGSSSQSTPLPSKPLRFRKNSEPSMTPREKANLFEKKRREDIKRRKEMIEQKETINNSVNHNNKYEVNEDFELDNMEVPSTEEEDLKFRETKPYIMEDEQSKVREKAAQEEKERLQMEQERERLKTESLEKIRMEEEKARREQAAREQKEREQKEQLETLRREEEEKRRKAAEEIERKAREEKERLERDALEQERRRQKDLLLAKMREIDVENKKKDADEEDNKSLDKRSNVSHSSAKKKEYNFSEAIENMHHGKPSRDDIKVPVLEKSKKSFLSDDSGSDNGHHPSFLSKPVKAKISKQKDNQPKNQQQKKAALMQQLFGENSGPVNKSHQVNTTDRENSSTLFGGGAALIENENSVPNSASQLLPRRPRQQSTTLHARPTVNAIDDIDDEIEEVIL